MKSWITTPQVTVLLGTLYAEAAKNDPRVHQAATEAGVTYESEADFFKAMRKAYLPVGREFGNLPYALARSSKSKRWWNSAILWYLNNFPWHPLSAIMGMAR